MKTHTVQRLLDIFALEFRSSGGKLFEASTEIQKALEDELSRLEKQYGGGKGVDLTKFPTFNFKGNS